MFIVFSVPASNYLMILLLWLPEPASSQDVMSTGSCQAYNQPLVFDDELYKGLIQQRDPELFVLGQAEYTEPKQQTLDKLYDMLQNRLVKTLEIYINLTHRLDKLRRDIKIMKNTLEMSQAGKYKCDNWWVSIQLLPNQQVRFGISVGLSLAGEM